MQTSILLTCLVQFKGNRTMSLFLTIVIMTHAADVQNRKFKINVTTYCDKFNQIVNKTLICWLFQSLKRKNWRKRKCVVSKYPFLRIHFHTCSILLDILHTVLLILKCCQYLVWQFKGVLISLFNYFCFSASCWMRKDISNWQVNKGKLEQLDLFCS